MRLILYYALSIILVSGLGLSQNSWEFTGGPYCGAAEVMTANSSGYIFAGTPTGVYRSTDDGDTWSYVTGSMGIIDIRALATKPSGIVFAGTNDGRIYRSVNNGDNWELVYQSSPPMFVSSLLCKSSGDVFAGIDSSGIFCSTNNGDSWLSKNYGLTNVEIKSLAVKPNGDLYTGTFNGLFISSDNGDNWIEIMLDTISYEIHNSGIMIKDDSTLFVRSDDYHGKYLFRSTDGGNSWNNISRRIDTIIIGGKKIPITKTVFQPTLLAIDSNKCIIGSGYKLGATEDVLFRSTDNGDNWDAILSTYPLFINFGYIYFYGFPGQDSLNLSMVRSTVLTPDGNMFVGTEIGGVLRFLANDTNWTLSNRYLASPDIFSMAINNSGEVFPLTEKGLWRSSEGGSNWARINENFLNFGRFGITCSPNGNIYIAHNYTWRSTNEGESWEACDSGVASYKMAVAAGSNGYIYSGNYINTLYKSTDDGDNWTPLYYGSSPVRCSLLVINPAGHIYVDAGNTPPFLRSTDDGLSWDTCGYQLLSDIYYDWAIIASFKSSACGFAAGDCGSYRSLDGGNTWEVIINGLPLSIRGWHYNYITGRRENDYFPPIFQSIAFNKDEDVFVGYDRGVYYSTDDGETWLELNLGLPPNTTIKTLVVDSLGYLYAGTDYGAVFKTSQITTSVTDPNKNIPTKFSLAQNYPNPFNPTTKINYQLPGAGARFIVSLKIYDLLGREIATLVNAIQETGHHAVEWNAKAATGVYFYRLEATSAKDPSKRFVETRKMLLLR